MKWFVTREEKIEGLEHKKKVYIRYLRRHRGDYINSPVVLHKLIDVNERLKELKR